MLGVIRIVLITEMLSASAVARVESLPLATKRLGDFVRGRISAFEPRESTRQVEGCLRVCL
jgi:hypothetical protein